MKISAMKFEISWLKQKVITDAQSQGWKVLLLYLSFPELVADWKLLLVISMK
ncbi:hypothetical protein SLEP1_g34483 [Rubroshorea leprosula]|uniref:Uncharacterized protein n=1 Tax=Rubroshorea leprosula TaxID=152421 RepID=A0AAV5KKB8_9ROSI|nr:hypothetical protein SLEP1_g34483 [Rubroshorea leprosula]